ncbi:MAG: hypothetical protein WBW25_08910 [Halobacteriota archaeon]|jgi:hypothetical protein
MRRVRVLQNEQFLGLLSVSPRIMARITRTVNELIFSRVKCALERAEVAGSNPAEPIGLLGCFDEIMGSGELFDFRFREEGI